MGLASGLAWSYVCQQFHRFASVVKERPECHEMDGRRGPLRWPFFVAFHSSGSCPEGQTLWQGV
eukprot:9511262-Lingulodinium_polyedra.AAC.1